MKYFFLFFFLSITLFSCKSKKPDYVIKGRLINNCDNTPIKNIKVQARQVSTTDGFDASAFSNQEGNFEILASTTQKTNFRFMNLNDEIPVDNIDFGNIPLYSHSNIYYKVKIRNPHVNNDTLFILDIETNKYIKMYAPFHDTNLGVKTITTLNVLAYNAAEKIIEKTNIMTEIKAWYKINRTLSTNVSIQANSCGRNADTLTLLVN